MTVESELLKEDCQQNNFKVSVILCQGIHLELDRFPGSKDVIQQHFLPPVSPEHPVLPNPWNGSPSAILKHSRTPGENGKSEISTTTGGMTA